MGGNSRFFGSVRKREKNVFPKFYLPAETPTKTQINANRSAHLWAKQYTTHAKNPDHICSNKYVKVRVTNINSKHKKKRNADRYQ